MTIPQINPTNGGRNAGAGMEQVVSLSERAATQLAQAATNVSAAVPLATVVAPTTSACLDKIYQWLVDNHGKLSGAQTPAMVNALVNQLNTAKTPDGKLIHKTDADLLTSVADLRKRFVNDSDNQDAFLDSVQGCFIAESFLMIDLKHEVFTKEVKEWFTPE